DTQIGSTITTSTSPYDFTALASGNYYVIAQAQNGTNTGQCSATSEVDTVDECYWFDINKVTQGIVDPTRDWTFAIYEGADGYGSGVLAADGTLGDTDGILDFGFLNLDPLKTYTICEENMAAGWSAIWVIDANGTQVVLTTYNPDADNNPMADLGNRCFEIGAGTSYPLVPNGTFTINVDNTYPGGAARTPGYWKNWSTCSGGGQVANAEKNGGWQAGFWLLDDVLNSPGITLGNLEVTDCEDGVNILDQREIYGSGKKKSSDAAYTLAMHLMAFELNQGAGAYHCQLAIDAAMEAHTLLISIGYDGTGDYFKTKGKKGSGTDNTLKSRALELANILDRYNNNLIDETECGQSVPTKEDIYKEVTSTTSIDAYPLPFANDLNLKVSIAYEAKVKVQLFDMLGKLIWTSQDRAVTPGTHVIQFAVDYDLADGHYIMSINTGKEVFTKMVFSQK
ncbi:MAG: T9SS type A sorting domain-containing protein, partial [Flavobacteriaceae bacterium]|nr:T9SS type A sorting domain-containing protein [Flavobacteriaceae bacterium]